MSRSCANLSAASGLVLTAATALRAFAGPDVITSDIGPDLFKYGTRDVSTSGVPDLRTGYSVTTVACNIGNAPAAWVDVTNQHPLIATQMYRLWNGRFEQIGMSWLKHSFCAADEQSCVALVPGSVFAGDTSCATLGLFAFDTYGAALNGQQFWLGPRSEVNPTTGAFPYPFTLGWDRAGDCLYKRLIIANSDLDPALYPGARYFCEVQYIAPDESASVRMNNTSYREVVAGPLSNGSPTGGCNSLVQGRILTFTGPVVPFKPAIEAWKAADPGVTLVHVDIPGEGGGRIVVAGRATLAAPGNWRYEYAIYNHHSHRAIGSLSLPKSRDPGLVLADLGFHAPAYHSGEPYSSAPWTPLIGAGSVTWSCEPFSLNPNAAAIRWGATATFRFTAARAPQTGTLTLGLFRPPAGLDDPTTLRVPGLPVPVDACIADFDASGSVGLQDLFDFLAAYFSGDPRADVNSAGGLSVQDVFDFLAAWFGGC